MSGKLTQQKRDREQHPRRSLGQPSQIISTTCPPLPEAPSKPKNNTPSVPVREDTSWPSTGKMSGNLFKERNWLLPKNYLVTENKNESATGVTSPRLPLKEEPKMEEQVIGPKAEKCGWGTDCLSTSPKRRKKKTSNSRSHHQMCQSLKLKDPIT